MGGPWIHRLTNVDTISLTATCANCGPTVIAINAAGIRCTRRPRPLSPGRKTHTRLWRYRLTFDDWSTLLIAQSGRCGICRTPMVRPHVDHDHACCPTAPTCGKCVRGLLCDRCNRGIALLGDGVPRLRQALEYLLAASTDR